MRIQTYQGFAVTETLRSGRTHVADSGFIDPDWSRAYDWMRDRLGRHLGRTLPHHPVWGWAAPTQRATDVCRGTTSDCAQGWCSHLVWNDVDLLELDVPDALVLTSCETAWTAYALNHSYLPDPEEVRRIEVALTAGDDADSSWRERLDAHLAATGQRFTHGEYPPAFDLEVQNSWERLLVPPAWPGDDSLGMRYGPRGPWIQGAFPHLDPAWVRRTRRISGPPRGVTVGPWEKWR